MEETGSGIKTLEVSYLDRKGEKQKIETAVVDGNYEFTIPTATNADGVLINVIDKAYNEFKDSLSNIGHNGVFGEPKIKEYSDENGRIPKYTYQITKAGYNNIYLANKTKLVPGKYKLVVTEMEDNFNLNGEMTTPISVDFEITAENPYPNVELNFSTEIKGRFEVKVRRDYSLSESEYKDASKNIRIFALNVDDKDKKYELKRNVFESGDRKGQDKGIFPEFKHGSLPLGRYTLIVENIPENYIYNYGYSSGNKVWELTKKSPSARLTDIMLKKDTIGNFVTIKPVTKFEDGSNDKEVEYLIESEENGEKKYYVPWEKLKLEQSEVSFKVYPKKSVEGYYHVPEYATVTLSDNKTIDSPVFTFKKITGKEEGKITVKNTAKDNKTAPEKVEFEALDSTYVNGEHRGNVYRNLNNLPYGTYTVRPVESSFDINKYSYSPNDVKVTVSEDQKTAEAKFEWTEHDTSKQGTLMIRTNDEHDILNDKVSVVLKQEGKVKYTQKYAKRVYFNNVVAGDYTVEYINLPNGAKTLESEINVKIEDKQNVEKTFNMGIEIDRVPDILIPIERVKKDGKPTNDFPEVVYPDEVEIHTKAFDRHGKIKRYSIPVVWDIENKKYITGHGQWEIEGTLKLENSKILNENSLKAKFIVKLYTVESAPDSSGNNIILIPVPKPDLSRLIKLTKEYETIITEDRFIHADEVAKNKYKEAVDEGNAIIQAKDTSPDEFAKITANKVIEAENNIIKAKNGLKGEKRVSLSYLKDIVKDSESLVKNSVYTNADKEKRDEYDKVINEIKEVISKEGKEKFTQEQITALEVKAEKARAALNGKSKQNDDNSNSGIVPLPKESENNQSNENNESNNVSTLISQSSDKGWKKDENGKWLYETTENNSVKNSWIKENNKWFFVDKDGVLVEEKVFEVKSSKFYAKKGGYISESEWINLDGNWYYTKSGGYMATNEWILYKNNWYWIGKDNVMFSNTWMQYKDKWYYFENNGEIVKDQWKEINKKWYHFNNEGILSVSTTVGKYKVDANGEWIKPSIFNLFR